MCTSVCSIVSACVRNELKILGIGVSKSMNTIIEKNRFGVNASEQKCANNSKLCRKFLGLIFLCCYLDILTAVIVDGKSTVYSAVYVSLSQRMQ